MNWGREHRQDVMNPCAKLYRFFGLCHLNDWHSHSATRVNSLSPCACSLDGDLEEFTSDGARQAKQYMLSRIEALRRVDWSTQQYPREGSTRAEHKTGLEKPDPSVSGAPSR
jgi:hypothetical protein